MSRTRWIGQSRKTYFKRYYARFIRIDVLRGLREGIEIEKGVVLTEDYLVEHFDDISKLMTEFSAYPDIYLDVITPSDSNFSLFFY